MQLTSLSFSDSESIPDRYAFGKIDLNSHVTLADNYNPQFSWSGAPAETQSFALICHDIDVPTKPDDVNIEGREVPEDLPRMPAFYHWVLVDLPAAQIEIDEGFFSNGITPRGKGGPMAPLDARQGLNDYTNWFAGDRDMSGQYFGYDGPCPPWNDSRVHRYIFTLYALDVPTLGLLGTFTGDEARAALKGHVLAESSLMGTYTLNPRLAPKQIGSTSS
jgi:Raf kinase inhibitor-like YbhB/YbcL family protein